MASTDRHQAAERAVRKLLPQSGLPQPDEVEYEEASIVLLWHELKLAVVVDLDDDEPEPDPVPERRRAAASRDRPPSQVRCESG